MWVVRGVVGVRNQCTNGGKMSSAFLPSLSNDLNRSSVSFHTQTWDGFLEQRNCGRYRVWSLGVSGPEFRSETVN